MLLYVWTEIGHLSMKATTTRRCKGILMWFKPVAQNTALITIVDVHWRDKKKKEKKRGSNGFSTQKRKQREHNLKHQFLPEAFSSFMFRIWTECT